MNNTLFRDFLEIPYDKLEEMNLSYKEERLSRTSADQIRERRQAYLSDEKRIKAVTVCFTDLEGRLHMLDYDKKFLLGNDDNLTFDGSSIRGFSQQAESDLRLAIDWTAFYMVPADIFGPGKVVVFGDVLERGGHPYRADMRLKLKQWCEQAYKRDGTAFQVATEIEGFLFKGKDAERRYTESGKFEFVSTGGYYHSLPGDALRTFIDRAAEVQRAMGFQNEKDHPEVAPSQFEMNFSYSDALVAADQVQLYKLLCRQVAAQADLTASFLPKPVTGVNGSGMHTNLSIARAGKNLFHDPKGEDGLSKAGWEVIDRILTSANDIALVLNPSVNAYRRLDPHYEAPNQIMASAINRGAMVRIPLGNERSARIEIRSVAPDANPYMVFYTLIRTGLDGRASQDASETTRSGSHVLPGNIIDAIRLFQSSKLTSMLYGGEVRDKFAELKQMAADRCPKQLGTLIKPAEVQFHHEVTNQWLWSMF